MRDFDRRAFSGSQPSLRFGFSVLNFLSPLSHFLNWMYRNRQKEMNDYLFISYLQFLIFWLYLFFVSISCKRKSESIERKIEMQNPSLQSVSCHYTSFLWGWKKRKEWKCRSKLLFFSSYLISAMLIQNQIPYTHHYNPLLIYSLLHFWRPFFWF